MIIIALEATIAGILAFGLTALLWQARRSTVSAALMSLLVGPAWAAFGFAAYCLIASNMADDQGQYVAYRLVGYTLMGLFCGLPAGLLLATFFVLAAFWRRQQT